MSHAGPRKRGCRAGTGARSHDIFFKTKLCSFWQAGICQRGAECKFAHGGAELMEEPDLSKTSFCRRMLSGEECQDPTCTFAHSRGELRNTSEFFKTSFCPFDRGTGRCKLGRYCRFAHASGELRQKPLAVGLYDESTIATENESNAENSEEEFQTSNFERSVTVPATVAETPGNEGWVTDDDDDDLAFDAWARMKSEPPDMDRLAIQDLPTWKAPPYVASTASSLPWLRHISGSSSSHASSCPEVPLQAMRSASSFHSSTCQSQALPPPLEPPALAARGACMAAAAEGNSTGPVRSMAFQPMRPESFNSSISQSQALLPPVASVTPVAGGAYVAAPVELAGMGAAPARTNLLLGASANEGRQAVCPTIAAMVPVVMIPYPVVVTGAEPNRATPEQTVQR
eukprot:TRINITY_DN42356_c0_g1_i1.p1 TRINITY_DN42356_c0_g1~~TRINITY_DN42356_c0_g1_i1.p1  ORF type:complete len:400 (-),score=66.27 TRINITY_DN42356_c0_g1_i1:96-1295(-)